MNKKDRQQNQEFSLTQSSSAEDHSSEVEPLLDDSTTIRSGDRSLSINHNQQNVVTDAVASAAQSEWTRRTVDDLALLVSNNFNAQQAQNSLQLHIHILESMAEGVVISDSDGTIIFSNSKFDSMFGYNPGELLGLPLVVLNDLPPQENQRFVDGIMATLKQEGSWSGEIRNRQQDGTPFLTEVRASALQLNGKTYLIGIQQDITERKRTEQRLATQSAIACTLAMATTLDDAIPEILQSLCQSLDWQLAAFWSLDRPSQQLSCCHIWHRPTLDAREFIDISQVASLTAGVGLPGEVLASHQSIWISDIQAEPNFPRAIWANRVGLRSAFAFPILIGQDCLGVIECYHERPQHPDPNLLHCMTAIGGQIGQFMERLYAEGSLSQSEKRYRTIFETVGISLWEEDFSDVKSLLDNLKQQGITDLQAYLQDHPSVIEEAIQRVKLCDVNQQTLKLFGAQSKAELLASLKTVFLPETKQIFMEEMIALAAGRPYFEAETMMQTLQGERRHILFTMTFPPDAASYKQVLVSVLDISDRVRAEQECQRLLQQEIILREAAEASKRVRDEFLTILSHELRTPLHLILAWATLIQQGIVSAAELPQVPGLFHSRQRKKKLLE